MLIQISKIIISNEALNIRFSGLTPIVLRIQCELISINSCGDVVSRSKLPIQSNIILIKELPDKQAEPIQVKLFFEVHVDETIFLSPFCNYSTVCLFKILNENSTYINNEIGYSILPLLNSEGRAFLKTISIPIIPEYQNSTKSQHIFEKNCIRNNETLIPMEFFTNSIGDILHNGLYLGSIIISVKSDINSTLLCFKKNKILSDELTLESDIKTSYVKFLNLVCKNYKFLKHLERNKSHFYMKMFNNRVLSLEHFNNTLRDQLISTNLENYVVNNKEKFEIESSIAKLYISYISGTDGNQFKDEVEFLWKHRYVISLFKGGIPLLLSNIDLKNESVILELTKLFKSSKFDKTIQNSNSIHLEDSLNLLSGDYKEYKFIRKFAIENLKSSKRNEIRLILPQLVQSLRYEVESELTDFLKKYATTDVEISIELLWLLFSEISDSETTGIFERTFVIITNELTNFKNSVFIEDDEQHCCRYHKNLEIIDLFLSQLRLMLTLQWIYNVSIEECKRERLERKIQKFQNLLQNFEAGNISSYPQRVFSNSSAINRIVSKLSDSIRYMLNNEHELSKNCKGVNLYRSLHSSKIVWGSTNIKTDKLNGDIKNTGLPILNIINLSEPLPLPIDISKALIGIVPNESFIIKSSLCPLILSCRIAVLDCSKRMIIPGRNMESENFGISESIYPVIESKYMYKVGDDLRQDQLVIQLLEISSKLLQEWNVNNSVKTYKILSFSKNDGLIAFLEDFHSIGTLRKKYGKNCILQYWANNNDAQIDKIPRDIISTFITSCAVYSVATFIVGVGDRHLDNLLVGKNGDFLHVDFGYIFGEDPKPFPPPMKVCTEMIEAMGGINSIGFKLFVDKCCEFYRYIRRRSWLFINLLLPMVDSGIKDLDSKSGANKKATLLKIKEKFRLELSEIEAEEYLREIIMTSSKALFPAVVDTLHEWALYWK